MTTTKPRIFVTLEENQWRGLKKIADQKDQSLSQTAAELMGFGLEALEDEWLSNIGDQRLANFKTRDAISFESVKRKFWKKSGGGS